MKLEFSSEEALKEYALENLITLDDFDERELADYLQDCGWFVYDDLHDAKNDIEDDWYCFETEQEVIDYVKENELIDYEWKIDRCEIDSSYREDVIDNLHNLSLTQGWRKINEKLLELS